MSSIPIVSEAEIARVLAELGLSGASTAIVHSSLRSFGRVEGGAISVCRALVSSGATLLFPAASGDCCGLPAPPGLYRPNNAPPMAASWAEFDQALDTAVPFSLDLPIDKELGIIPETMRLAFPHVRSWHPLFSYLAVGSRARELVDAQRIDWPLGPLERLAELDGWVLLMGVLHTSNTAIHLAEQRLGRARFYRYAKADAQAWMELANIPGDSHRFDEIEPHCQAVTREVRIGNSRVRCIPIRAMLAIAEKVILENPAALLCEDRECRCYAALQQRLLHL